MSETKIIEMKDYLNSWAGQQISIRKEEAGDLDQITISLEEATFEQRDAEDEYLGDHILFLHGRAYSTGEGSQVELPSVMYEVPLDGINDVRLDNSIITFQTNRAQYAISIN
ncbi:hypothetical protein ACFFJY_16265 [Fictibacillus aquaticus]|uniref:Uncharacterized protein n=1 Tax=Fictibacillus aquaticus TaxID=2021314 RepID=A0A235F6X2_9BACL|nr:hypothetical protein [Fictibacillus aquaticus]OYD56864.1 hypothetical protein CGZ90_15020 [Fictibacillus aquaticus]